MCCFSQPVTRVERTRIFARRVDRHTQSLAYAMHVEAAGDLAMVLPLPTDPAAGEGAVTFVDLSRETYLFTALDALFPQLESDAMLRVAPQPASRRQTLAVQTVGDYVASFVPSASDFDRLDARFRLPADVVAALTERDRFGFAVFQLRGFADAVEPPPRAWWQRVFARGDAPPKTQARRAFHPMGLTFRSRDAAALFLPTVHVHDGTLPATAHFDHTLYVQGAADDTWETSESAPHPLTVQRAEGILAEGARVRRLTMAGTHPNRDVIVAA